jgi:hypothetical protein
MTTSYRVGRSAEPKNVDERASNRLDRRDRRNCGCLRHLHSAAPERRSTRLVVAAVVRSESGLRTHALLRGAYLTSKT